MRTRSERWAKLAARGRFTMETKARIGGTDYTAISAPKIDRSLLSSPLSVGNCTSATLGLSILTDDNISSSSPIVIMGRLTNGETYSEWKEFGTFFINQRDTSFAGLITVDCFDAMLKANQNYVSDNDTSVGWPKTMKAVVEEIAYRIGVGIDPRTKINTGADYSVPFPSGKTMIQVLGSIGACHGGNWIITEDNLLRLVPLVTSPDETFHLIDEDYEHIKTAQNDQLVYKLQTVYNATLPATTGVTPGSTVPITHYVTDEHGSRIVTSDGHFLVWAADGSVDAVNGLIDIPVVCGKLNTGKSVTITGISASNDKGNSYTAGNSNGTVLTVEGNPYMTQSICTALYTAFNGLVYSPYTATKTLYDPATELGDQVKIGDTVCSVLYCSTLSFDLNFRADISAPNSEELSEEYPYLSDIKKLKQSAQDLNSAIQKTASDLEQAVGDVDEETSLATVQQGLASEITRASSVEQTLSTNISAEETRAENAESALSGRITALENNSSGNVTQRLSTLESTVSGHGTRITALETTVANISGSSTDISELTENVEENTEYITDLREKASLHTSWLNTIDSTITQHTNKLNTLTERITIIEDISIGVLSRLNVIEGNGNPAMEISVSLLPAENTYRLGEAATASANNQTVLTVAKSGNEVLISGNFNNLSGFYLSDNYGKWACIVYNTGESDITTVSLNGYALTAGDVAKAAEVDITSGSFVMWANVTALKDVPTFLTLSTENKTAVSLLVRFTDTTPNTSTDTDTNTEQE